MLLVVFYMWKLKQNRIKENLFEAEWFFNFISTLVWLDTATSESKTNINTILVHVVQQI